MKKLSLLAGMLFLIATTISPTSLNGRFVVLSKDATKLAVQLQINTNTGIDDLGSATIVICFNKNVLHYNDTPVNQIDYVFQNFNGGNYGIAKVTKPINDKIWINVYLPFANDNKGTVVSGPANWTNVVTLYFDITSPQDTINLKWLSTNTFWGVYDGDNKSFWTSGSLTDLQILPETVLPLEVTDVITTNSKSVVVKFSKKVNSNTANNKSNYTISNNITINQVQLQPDSTSVLIKTSQQQSDIDYFLTVKSIKDIYGNTITPDPLSIQYKLPVKGNGNKVKTPINKVVTSSWISNFTPEKMMDGSNVEVSDSRWESAKLMPDTVTFQLEQGNLLDSLRISFFGGEAGRLYEYSAYVSEDLKDWKVIISNMWSENSIWTVVEFDSTRGNYLRLIINQCNQNARASIREFESYGTKIVANLTDVKQHKILPNKFELLQNYPNPFNPSTIIRYTIPNNATLSDAEGAKVTLKVYDILGNELTTLVNEQKPAGTYEVEFKADNLASGVYVYRLNIVGFTETKKMILLR